MKKLILTFIMLMWGSLAYAQTPSNYGFEDGTYAGWTASNGSTTLRTSWSDNGSECKLLLVCKTIAQAVASAGPSRLMDRTCYQFKRAEVLLNSTLP